MGRASRILRPSWTERLAILFAIAASLSFELVLAERKYGLFGGGFGQSHALAGAWEIALFLVTVASAQALIVCLSYWLIGTLLHRRARRLVRLFTFLFATLGGLAAVVVAKFQVLSYFSDSVSFGLLRNLGGGSLLDAALFGLSESALIVQSIGGAIILWLVGLVVIRRFASSTDRTWPRAIGWRGIALISIAMPVLLLAGARNADVRHAVVRMTSGIL